MDMMAPFSTPWFLPASRKTRSKVLLPDTPPKRSMIFPSESDLRFGNVQRQGFHGGKIVEDHGAGPHFLT
ncbi:MAG: hypothetical protein MZV70_42125 [Desulfobacterales bacterium]|nr:hypothetical protein [Desulfobacterales bacterium]